MRNHSVVVFLFITLVNIVIFGIPLAGQSPICNGGLCIDTGGATGSSLLTLAKASGAASQSWTAVAAPISGWSYLKNSASGLCMDVQGGSQSAGALIVQYTCTPSSAEYFQSAANGTILSHNMTNGCLQALASNVEQNTCNGSAAQVWTSASTPAPSITSLSPSSVTVGAAAEALTINGTNFLSSSTVTYNGVSHTVTYISATQLMIQLSVSDQATAGSYAVVVTSPAPGGASNSFSFLVTSATNPGIGQLSNPADGATDVDPAVNIAWTNVLTAQGYKLSLSTVQPGGADAWQSGELPNVSSLAEMHVIPNTLYYYNFQTFTPPALQAHTTYYARLWTNIANTWYYDDSTFTTGYGTARLTSPADGQGGLGATVAFTWNAIADAVATTPYYLYVGTNPNQLSGGTCTSANACVWQSGPTSATSATIPSGILKANTAYYARLWTQKSSQSFYVDTSFSTGSFSSSSPTLSQMVYPQNGATNVNPFAPIRWTTVPVAKTNGYFLYIGDGTSGDSKSDYVYYVTNQTAWEGALAGGKTYYVTLYTLAAYGSGSCKSGCWTAASFTFTTAPVATPPSQSGFYSNIITATETVRNMAAGNTDATTAHTFLYNNTQPGGVALCSDFANNLMVQLTKQGIVAHRRDTVFGGGPESHSIVEYWDPFLGKWAATDSFFGMTFYDPSKNPQTMGIGEIAQALVQGNESEIPNTFVTSASVTTSCPTCFGSYWDMTYALDPILHYLNPLSMSHLSLELSTANDPRPFMLSITNPVGTAATYVFSFANATDSVTINSGGKQIKVVPQPSTAPTGTPINFGNFSGPISLKAGWSYVGNPPAGMTAKRLECPMYHGPACP